MEGNLVTKNQNTNKVFSIIDEIGKCPILVFGNSSGDLAMAQYVLQHGGKGYMLLCDDTERDYGDLAVAAKFADSCEKMGLETVSMKNDFATIYGDNAVKVDRNWRAKSSLQKLRNRLRSLRSRSSRRKSSRSWLRPRKSWGNFNTT